MNRRLLNLRSLNLRSLNLRSLNRRSFLKWANLAGLAAGLPFASAFGATTNAAKRASPADAPATTKAASPETLLLKDYRPQSIYKIPVTEIAKAKFPMIDMHSHPYAKSAAEIDQWVRNMDEVGVEKTIILTMTTGAEFDEIHRKYAKHPQRFEMWCGFDLAGYDKSGFGPSAVKELERCKQSGARGVGEIHDKGKGLISGKSNAPGMHPDDPRMDSLWDKCGDLGCRSACMSPIRSGCIRRWTGQRRADECLRVAARQSAEYCRSVGHDRHF